MAHLKKICILMVLVIKIEAEEFNSIPKLEKLLKTQGRVIMKVKKFVEKENDRLNYLEDFVKRLKKEQAIAAKDITHYVGNPINAFTLIKRLSGDIEFVESVLKNKTGYSRDPIAIYPSEKDVLDAMAGLLRIQTTYKLNVTQLANGIVTSTFSADRKPFKESVAPMTASDCYDVGRLAQEDKNYQAAVLWMTEALNKYEAENCVLCNFTDVNIVDQISQFHYLLGNIEETIQWTKRLIALQPNHPDTSDRTLFVNGLEDQLEHKIAAQKYKQEKSDGGKTSTKIKKKLSAEEYEHYLCAGYYKISKEIRKSLTCYYARGPHPLLKLAPVKAEQLYIKPDVFMFYDLVTNAEIKTLRYMAKLQALIDQPEIDSKTPLQLAHNIHVSVLNEHSPVITKLLRRTSQVTGLSMKHSERLKVLSYGIGGMYERHYDNDHKDVEKDFFDKYGERISTIKYYLSSVEGGATVFPYLYLTVYPVKGAALFFNNLLPSGDVDHGLAYMDCPVIHGTKWIAIKSPQAMAQRFCPIWMTRKGIMTGQKYAQLIHNIKLLKGKQQKKKEKSKLLKID